MIESKDTSDCPVGYFHPGAEGVITVKDDDIRFPKDYPLVIPIDFRLTHLDDLYHLRKFLKGVFHRREHPDD